MTNMRVVKLVMPLALNPNPKHQMLLLMHPVRDSAPPTIKAGRRPPLYVPPARLQPQLIQNSLRHILILPRPPIDLLKLDPMQTQQRDLDNENLKFQHHTTAQIALDLRARLPRRTGDRWSWSKHSGFNALFHIGVHLVFGVRAGISSHFAAWVGWSLVAAEVVAVAVSEAAEGDFALVAVSVAA